jgi:hypothetical protein
MERHSVRQKLFTTFFEETVAQSREVIKTSRDLLDKPLPDIFLGRSTFKPFPSDERRPRPMVWRESAASRSYDICNQAPEMRDRQPSQHQATGRVPQLLGQDD